MANKQSECPQNKACAKFGDIGRLGLNSIWREKRARVLVTNSFGNKMMTIRFAVLLGHLLIVSSLHAQIYPYCAQYSGGSSLDCSFSTLSMCNQSVSGVGGICILNPRGPGPSTAGAGPPPFNATYVPPPPIQQQSSGPVALPSAPHQCNPVVDGTYCATAGVAASQSIAPIQSLSGDLAVGTDPPATLGAITFNSDGTNCIALFRRMSCGGP